MNGSSTARPKRNKNSRSRKNKKDDTRVYEIGLGFVWGLYGLVCRVYEIGLGFLWCTIDLIKHATSIVIAGLCVLAKLPWIVLKSILRKLDDYILTPPLMEKRSKSKLHFHLQIFCQPFKPCWALAMCSKCKFEQDWDDRPAALSSEDTNDFCILRCVNRNTAIWVLEGSRSRSANRA